MAKEPARASNGSRLGINDDIGEEKRLTLYRLQVEIRENRMIVRLGDKILFDPGKTDLKPEGKDALKQVTEVLKSLPNRNFQIAGHTDNAPMKSAKTVNEISRVA